MKCDECQREIPKDDENHVILGGIQVFVPFCYECIKKMWKEFDEFPEPDGIAKKRRYRRGRLL
jgi:hypothetical protein